MSVPNQTPYIIYNANGLTTVFPFEFYIINAADLQVSINGTTVTSGYSVSGTGNVGGGDVTFITPPVSGSVVMLERVVPTYRLTDYQDNGDLLADTVNKDFDRLWMAIQRSFIYLGLALRRPLLGGPYNAEGYRISRGADPVEQQDFATKNYVDNVSIVRALRVPDSFVPEMPPLAQMEGKLIAIAGGRPVGVLPPSGSASEVLTLLASKDGYSLIGEVQSISGFYGMTGATGKKVRLKGWYAGSSVGGGDFYFDATIAKSKHDGGVYISPTVPYSTILGDFVNGIGESDSTGYGVWVRSLNVEHINTDWYGVNNGQTSHGAAFQKAFNAAMSLGLNVIINSNKDSSAYYIDTNLTLGPSTSGQLLTPCLYGEGKNVVKIRTLTSLSGYALTINGNHPTEGRFEMSGFDIQADISSGSSPSGSGINIKNMNTFYIHDLRVSVYNLCINYDNILYGKVSRVTCYRGNTGMVFQNGNPNMITLIDCEFLSMIVNSLRVYKGCPFIVDTCSFEGSGSVGDVAFRAIRYTGGLDDGGQGLTVRNSYFEANSGVNIQIDHNTQRSALHTISNNTFNNTSSSKYTISDIYLLGGSVAFTGANKVILECRSNTHFGAGTYVASSTRPRVSITQFSTGGNGHCEFRDFGNRYMTGENPTFDSVVYVKYSYNFSGKAYVGSDAATTSSVNVSSVTKPSTGTYVITLNHIIYGNHVTLTP
ncbi:hypothetical protein Q8V91_004571, partial [Enterobacter hormaechei]|nr:hypothetical protein [Enterobacter hormaechei]